MTPFVVRFATFILLVAALATGDTRMLTVSIILFCLARGMDMWMARR